MARIEKQNAVYCFECREYVDATTHPGAFTPQHLEQAQRRRMRRVQETGSQPSRPTPTVKTPFSVAAGYIELAELKDDSELEAYRRGRRAV
jgi:hypothetical protein